MVKRRFRIHDLLLMIMLLVPQLQVYAGLDKKIPFVYAANQEGIEEVVSSIASSFGYSVKASGLPSKAVTARIEGTTLASTLNDMGRTFKFDWFSYGSTIYLFGSAEWRTEKVYVGDREIYDWKETLTAAGLWNDKFNVTYQKEDKSVVLNAPRDYIHIFRKNFAANDESLSNRHSEFLTGGRDGTNKSNLVMPGDVGENILFFKLKHASVDDRIFNFRDQEFVTPGVVTVIRGILEGTNTDKGPRRAPDNNRSNQPGTGQSANSQSESPRLSARPVKRTYSRSSSVNSIIQGDSRTNTVIIRDDQVKYGMYQKLIESLDVALPMIEIEATLIDVDQRKLDELGTEFGIRGPRAIYDFPGQSVGAEILPGLAQGAVIQSPSQFLARIRALAADQNAKVLARPTILTQDNLTAFIDLTQTLYVKVSGERVADVVPVVAGSLLKVLPRVVNEDGRNKILLQVDIQDGSLKDRSGVELPLVENSALSTQAVISENQAILVGGYNRDTSEQNEYKVPGLGSIPVLGKLFSNTSLRTQRVARLFMITPRLVPNDRIRSVGTVRAAEELETSFKIIQVPKDALKLQTAPVLRTQPLPIQTSN